MPIWLLKIWNVLKLVGTWLKGNWLIVLLGIGFVFTLVFLRRTAQDNKNLVKQIQDQMNENRKNLEKMKEIQEEHLVKEQEINKKYREVLLKIEQDYKEQLKELDSKKQKELKNIIAANNNDPNAMAQQINQLFGITILPVSVSPPEEH